MFLIQLNALLIKSPLLKIKVIPSSPKTEITDILSDETIKIRIKAQPEKGKANKELIKFLSQKLNIPKTNIEIIAGQTKAKKLIKINLPPIILQ